MELQFPVPFLENTSGTRLSAFLDIGNVFENVSAFDTGELRYSAGVAGLWSSPLGPISASIGVPLNAQSGDEKQLFQFTVGTFF